MSWVEALILGAVQGLSEFLPISSTAHLVLVEKLLGLSAASLVLEIILHFGSAAALVLFFRKDLYFLLRGAFLFLFKKQREYRAEFLFCAYMFLATVMTGFFGVLLKDALDASLKSPQVLGAAFGLTGVLLCVLDFAKINGSKNQDQMTWRDAFWVGVAQTIAVIPGVSRSGATLLMSLFRGLDKDLAVRFSFFLAIPVILGSSVLGIRDWNPEEMSGISFEALALGLLTSFVFSIIGIIWLIDFVRKSRLYLFGIYCLILSGCCFVFKDYFS
ncbi:MAG: undecaprenyl-diphosphate phosphatase [Bdellovibrionota bacterium]